MNTSMHSRRTKSGGPKLDAHQIVIRPLITEKGTHQSTHKAAYPFEVNPWSTKDEIKGAKGDVCTAAIKRTTSVVLTDWDSFVKYVVETESWDLLRKQPASNAVKARWDEKEEVPGTEPFVSIGLSLTKVGD